MEIFLGGFGIFMGIIAGALIQHALNGLTARKQAGNALRVLQIEISYNLREVDEFLDRLRKLRSRIEAGQASAQDMFFAMHKFDYSIMAPLNNSGYFHMLLGPERLKAYLEFVHFFRAENGEFLAQRLNEYHE